MSLPLVVNKRPARSTHSAAASWWPPLCCPSCRSSRCVPLAFWSWGLGGVSELLSLLRQIKCRFPERGVFILPPPQVWVGNEIRWLALTPGPPFPRLDFLGIFSPDSGGWILAFQKKYLCFAPNSSRLELFNQQGLD